MTHRTLTIIWGAIVLVLLAIIAYALLFNRQVMVSDPVLQPDPVAESTIEPIEPTDPETVDDFDLTVDPLETNTGWKTYISKDLGFQIDHPESAFMNFFQDGMRIENLNPERLENYKIKPDDYYIEIFTETGEMDCEPMFQSWRTVTINGYRGLRGQANLGPYDGYRHLSCLPHGSGSHLVSVTTGEENMILINRVLDSFSLLR